MARSRSTASNKSVVTIASSALSRPLIPHLRATLESLNPAERMIAQEILADPERVITSSIAELAERAGASVGSVVAFCRRLGLEGFAAFKIALARDLAHTVDRGAKVKHDASAIEQAFALHIESLLETKRLNSEAELEAAAQMIANARRIEFFSVGLSFPIAYAAHCKFSLIGLPSSAQFDPHMQTIAATQLCEGDLAFAIAGHGNIESVNESLEVAKSKGASTMCITNTVGTEITKRCDISLFASPSETNYYKTSLVSRLTQLALVDVLFGLITQSLS